MPSRPSDSLKEAAGDDMDMRIPVRVGVLATLMDSADLPEKFQRDLLGFFVLQVRENRADEKERLKQGSV